MKQYTSNRSGVIKKYAVLLTSIASITLATYIVHADMFDMAQDSASCIRDCGLAHSIIAKGCLTSKDYDACCDDSKAEIKACEDECE